MSKPQAKRIPSDDCIVFAGRTYSPDGTIKEPGEACAPHEGEWVDMFTESSVGELKAVRRLRELGTQLEAAKGEADEQSKAIRLSDDAFTELCQALAPRIKTWSWTDDAGRPMPQPDGTAASLQPLKAQELMWLLSAAQGEVPSERKNDLSVSPITSSVIELMPTSESTGALNPMSA